MAEPQKSTWDKVDILLRPVGGLLTALAVAWLGLQGRAVLEARQTAESKSQLYAQLMSSREQSDSSLRQAMFQTIIDEFLAVGPQDGDNPPQDSAALLDQFAREVLKLEVLAYNFHDALDLAPLFKDVYRRLTNLQRQNAAGVDERELQQLVDRLEKVAKEVIDKQIAALEISGAARRGKIDLETFAEAGILEFINEPLTPTDGASNGSKLLGKKFVVEVLGLDEQRKEVEIRLQAWPIDSDDQLADVTFKVGFFDFPMIDNTRLGDGERCAIVLNSFDEFHAGIALVYFPGSRASLKEKPFYDEIIDDLIEAPQAREGT
jgi:hypothetical protein